MAGALFFLVNWGWQAWVGPIAVFDGDYILTKYFSNGSTGTMQVWEQIWRCSEIAQAMLLIFALSVPAIRRWIDANKALQHFLIAMTLLMAFQLAQQLIWRVNARFEIAQWIFLVSTAFMFGRAIKYAKLPGAVNGYLVTGPARKIALAIMNSFNAGNTLNIDEYIMQVKSQYDELQSRVLDLGQENAELELHKKYLMTASGERFKSQFIMIEALLRQGYNEQELKEKIAEVAQRGLDQVEKTSEIMGDA